MKRISTEIKGVGINPQSQIHYTDHLAVICILMEIPLIFMDAIDYNLGKRYYPGLHAELIDFQELTPDYLASHYDVFFLSDLWDKQSFHKQFAPFEKKYKKIIRQVHCPHGFSDKGFYLKKCANEDIALLYGQNMIDQLKHHKVFQDLSHYVLVGNYRYTYFKQHQPFFDHLVKEEVLSRFAKSQPTILYAPTWMDLEESSTFFDAYAHVLGNLPDHYNLIVKLHPRLELDDTPQYYRIVGKFEGRANIIFLRDFPLVYPLLAHADLYLGDMSSVGYDFLAFNKPMFFLNKQERNPKKDRGLYLFRCGREIKPDQYSQIYQMVDTHLQGDQKLFEAIRQEVYTYTFGEEKPFADIKADILHTLQA